MPGVRWIDRRHARSHRARHEHPGGDDAQEAAPPSPLRASVLVLNRLYMAVHVVTVRRAIGLLCRDLAEVIHYESGTFANYDFESWRQWCELRAGERQADADWIRSVNFDLQVPRVIRLFSFDRVPRQQVHLNRRNILARDGQVCQYCGRHFPAHQLSIDHVIPKSRGGQTTWENVVCACLECNIRKGGRTPKEARMQLVRAPARPTRNPAIALKLGSPKYQTWRTWLDGVYWDIGLKD